MDSSTPRRNDSADEDLDKSEDECDENRDQIAAGSISHEESTDMASCDAVEESVSVSSEEQNKISEEIQGETYLRDYAIILKDGGYDALQQHIEQDIDQWKHIPINIAVIGESGTGKSTFINAIRGITDATSTGAAAVGSVETTSAIAKYPHPEHPNLILWDLPGVGSPKFPKRSYLKDIEFSKYDFFLLTTANRFKENDSWLAKEVNKAQKTFYFLRTMIDVEIDKDRKAHSGSHNTEKLVKRIRKDINDQLQKAGIISPKMFLIDNYTTTAFDFEDLVTTLIKEAPQHKQEAMILSVSIISKDVLKTKVKLLRKRIFKSAALASLGGLVPIPGSTAAVNAIVIYNEGQFFQRQLGIDEESVTRIALRMETSLEQFYEDMSLRTVFILKSKVSLLSYLGPMIGLSVGLNVAIPFFGEMIAVAVNYPICVFVMRKILRLCEEEAMRVYARLSDWMKSHPS